MSASHDKDLLARFQRLLTDEPEDCDVPALDFLTDKCGCSMEDATRIVIQLLIQTTTAPPELLRVVANELDIELPLLPFFES